MITLKSAELDAIPFWPSTVMGPSVAPAGTFVAISVGELIVKTAWVPLKRTDVTSPRFVPVRITLRPTLPCVGVNEVIVDGGRTVKSVALVAVPAEFITVIRPVVAPTGTVAVIFVVDTTVKDAAAAPLNPTNVVAVKFVPLIVTTDPWPPIVGEKEVIVGAAVTMKSVELAPVPTALVTAILPVVAPIGTVAVICASELTVKLALTVPNLTVVVPVKSSPVMITVAPTGPVAGENEETIGSQ